MRVESQNVAQRSFMIMVIACGANSYASSRMIETMSNCQFSSGENSSTSLVGLHTFLRPPVARSGPPGRLRTGHPSPQPFTDL